MAAVPRSDPDEVSAPEPALSSLPNVALLTLVGGVVVLGVTATTLALWEGHTVVLLLFLSYTLAAAVRPGVETLARYGIPRALGVAAHLVALAAVVGLVLFLLTPIALEQTQQALTDVPQHATAGSDGAFDSVKQQALTGVERKLRTLSEPDAALSALVGTLAALASIAFTLAAAVYWVAERDRLVNLLLALVPHSKRSTVRDTWLLVDLKLGAVIRTKLLLICMTGSILSLAFWIIGLPYFVLVGVFAGVVEVLPVIGPLLAGLAAVAVGFSVSWKVALAAALVVYGLRILQDYVINPRLFGRAVHLPPLAVLIAVSALALLLGPMWVPLAIPLTAVFATLLDVVVWKQDPAEKRVPTVLAPTRETVESRRRRPWERAREVSKEAGRA